MNLISCDFCGVVLDKIKLHFPEDIYLPSGSVNIKKAIRNGQDYVPFVKCPVCSQPIPCN